MPEQLAKLFNVEFSAVLSDVEEIVRPDLSRGARRRILGGELAQCTKAGIEPLLPQAGCDESGTQVGLLAIARCPPLREEGTHTLALRGSDSAFEVQLVDVQR